MQELWFWFWPPTTGQVTGGRHISHNLSLMAAAQRAEQGVFRWERGGWPWNRPGKSAGLTWNLTPSLLVANLLRDVDVSASQGFFSGQLLTGVYLQLTGCPVCVCVLTRSADQPGKDVWRQIWALCWKQLTLNLEERRPDGTIKPLPDRCQEESKDPQMLSGLMRKLAKENVASLDKFTEIGSL